jgi:hypothetical protein
MCHANALFPRRAAGRDGVLQDMDSDSTGNSGALTL